MEYTEKLKQIRKEHGESQAQIAQYLQIPQTQWQRYETGKNELPLRYLVAFCRRYEVSADYILGLTE